MFKTLDGLFATRDCPEIEPGAHQINLPMWTGSPKWDASPPDLTTPNRFLRYRCYEQTGDYYDDIPIFEETTATPQQNNNNKHEEQRQD